MRAAIYFTPPAGAPLTRTAARWLGRSAFDGEPTRAPDPAVDPLVASPARYGFHATMRAPFRFAEGVDLAEVDARLAAFCASRDRVRIDRLVIARLGPFFALVPERAPEALGDLEAAVVNSFEPLRAAATPQEIARRQPEALSERQRDYLAQWGYPHVFEEFRFHMTLTGKVPAAERDTVEAQLRDTFGEFDGAPLAIDHLALFMEPEPGAPFRVHSVHPFRRPSEDA
ncbi:DUF1045 domain-containing protein [Aurantimonas sp. A2-1-M11]|uniref:DUF1045 domain-containing protein n=1 Tax=Aurantimonas sp. A2-1-M11 TaxID=3113712 RepID=UPI002F95782A